MESTRASDDLRVGGMSSDHFNSLQTLQQGGNLLVSFLRPYIRVCYKSMPFHDLHLSSKVPCLSITASLTRTSKSAL